MTDLAFQNSLFVFDFDNTLIDVCIDEIVANSAQNPAAIQEIQKTYAGENWLAYWTRYMNDVLRYLQSVERLGLEDFDRILKNKVPWTAGMKELLQELAVQKEKAGNRVKLALISDANACFIHSVLKHANFEGIFDGVLTNFLIDAGTGIFQIEPYHTNTECQYSTSSLCKQKALQELLDDGEIQNLKPRLFYIGDGENDLCPVLKFEETDTVYCRKGHNLEKLISEGGTHQIAAKIVSWTTGLDILKNLQEM